MVFGWDETKNQSNCQKHGVSFKLASLVFQDPYLVSVPDKRLSYLEERWQSIGLVRDTVIYVAHLVEESDHGEESIRIISARQATPSEQRRYVAYRHTGKATQRIEKQTSKTR